MAIKFYKSNAPYGFLNNFYRSRFFLYHHWWNWVEAPYQAMKTLDLDAYERIRKAATPREARDLGQTVKLHDSWEDIKVEVMYQCCLAKFTQNPDLMDQLMATGGEELIEDSPVDSFWGCGEDGKGQNQLGKVLMRVRRDLKDG